VEACAEVVFFLDFFFFLDFWSGHAVSPSTARVVIYCTEHPPPVGIDVLFVDDMFGECPRCMGRGRLERCPQRRAWHAARNRDPTRLTRFYLSRSPRQHNSGASSLRSIIIATANTWVSLFHRVHKQHPHALEDSAHLPGGVQASHHLFHLGRIQLWFHISHIVLAMPGHGDR
jgi:hypothetical protein